MPVPQPKDAPARISIKELIYQTLRTWIIDGTLQPNEVINDTEIAKYFSSSRTPVREALLLLERQGFVEVTPSRGTRTASLSKDSARMIYEALAELSGCAATLACKKQTKEELDNLKALNAVFTQAVEHSDQADILACDANFHAAIFQMAANEYLSDYAQQLTIHAQRYEYYFFKNGKDKTASVRDHNAIIQALEGRDAELARQASSQNWLGFFYNRLEKLL